MTSLSHLKAYRKHSTLAINAGLAFIYFTTGLLCTSVASSQHIISPILFIPEGVALTAAILFGARCSYGVFFGQFALAYFNGLPLLDTFAVSIFNGTEVILASLLVKRCEITTPIQRIKDYLKLAALILFVLQPFSALLSNIVLWLDGIISTQETFWKSVVIWWGTNSLAQLLITPALLIYFNPRTILAESVIKLEDILAAVLLPVTVFLIFIFNVRDLLLTISIILPLELFLAYRGRIFLFSLSASLTSIFAAAATSMGDGPFTQYGHDSLSHLNLFIFGLMLPAQMICMLIYELRERQSEVLRLSEDRVQFLTYFDPLTQLPNRFLGESQLESTIKACRAEKSLCAIVLIDLDDFSQINDAYGKAIADDCLKVVAQRIKARVSANNHLCRLGGDNFLIILKKVESQAWIEGYIEQLRARVAEVIETDASMVNLTASFGVALIQPDNANNEVESCLLNAESALLVAKRDGKNLCRFYKPEMRQSTANFVTLADGLRTAIEKKELSLLYQPQINLETGGVVGAEALLRWERLGLGTLTPAAFIQIAERTGLIVPIGEWVLRNACAQAVQWHNNGFPDLSISINVSTIQIHRSEFGQMLNSILKETNIKPELVTLELTESAVLQEDESVQKFLEQVYASGVKISIDDFGTGFSNLTYIKRLNIDRIKIDQSFVQGLTTSETDRYIVESIIDLSHGLKAVAIAEGIENEATLAQLKSLGCKQGQGYFLARPMQAAAFTAFAKSKISLLKNTPEEHQTSNRSTKELKLERAEEKFQMLFEHSPIGMAMIDHNTGAFKEVNQALLDWTGYTQSELLNLSFWDITPREYEAQELAQIEELNKTGHFGPNYKEYIRKDGSRFPIEISAFKMADVDGSSVVWGVIKNLESTNHNSDSSASFNQLKDLDFLLDVVCMVNADNRFVFVSAASEKVFGYAPEEMIGKQMMDFVHPEDLDVTMQTANKVVSKNYMPHFENRYIRKDGEVVDIMWTARWSDKDQLRIAVARDITQRKRSEALQSTLYKISETIYHTENLKKLFQKIHKILNKHLSADYLAVSLYDKDFNALNHVYHLDTKHPLAGSKPFIPESLYSSVLEDAKPKLLTQNALREYKDYSQLNEPISWIGLPLQIEQRTIGVLELRNYANSREYKEQDLEALQYISGQIASAIERKQLHDKLQHMALYDELTQLPNRNLFADRLNSAIARAKRKRSTFSLCYLDLNDFKLINDDFGHLAGDKVLKTIAERLSQSMRAEDTFARIGGDELVCIFEKELTKDQLDKLIQKIRELIYQDIDLDGKIVNIKVSVGVAYYPENGATVDQLLKSADDAMYADKRKH